jgi:hypothetical protein
MRDIIYNTINSKTQKGPLNAAKKVVSIESEDNLQGDSLGCFNDFTEIYMEVI